MKIYINAEFKCHTGPGEGLREIDTPFFDNCDPAYIEGYRFVPAGESWTKEDGEVFQGEMICPWKPWEELDKFQREYERAHFQELTAQNTELLDAMAAMVDDVYNQDMAEIEEGTTV